MDATLKYISVDSINIVDNPRSNFSDDGIKSLADSIREHGILQPLVLSAPDDGNYRLISGERRLRVAKLAGLTVVPCVFKDGLSDDKIEAVQLVENIQREDLSPLDTACALRNLIDYHGYKQVQLAKTLGKSESWVSKYLKVLQLPEPLHVLFVGDGCLTKSHAAALCNLLDSHLVPAATKESALPSLAEKAYNEGLTSAQLTALVEGVIKEATPKAKKPPKQVLSDAHAEAYDILSSIFGDMVKVKPCKDGVKVVLTAKDDELPGILAIMTRGVVPLDNEPTALEEFEQEAAALLGETKAVIDEEEEFDIVKFLDGEKVESVCEKISAETSVIKDGISGALDAEVLFEKTVIDEDRFVEFLSALKAAVQEVATYNIDDDTYTNNFDTDINMVGEEEVTYTEDDEEAYTVAEDVWGDVSFTYYYDNQVLSDEEELSLLQDIVTGKAKQKGKTKRKSGGKMMYIYCNDRGTNCIDVPNGFDLLKNAAERIASESQTGQVLSAESNTTAESTTVDDRSLDKSYDASKDVIFTYRTGVVLSHDAIIRLIEELKYGKFVLNTPVQLVNNRVRYDAIDYYIITPTGYNLIDNIDIFVTQGQVLSSNDKFYEITLEEAEKEAKIKSYGIISAIYESRGTWHNYTNLQIYDVVTAILAGDVEIISETRNTAGMIKGAYVYNGRNLEIKYGDVFANVIKDAREQNKRTLERLTAEYTEVLYKSLSNVDKCRIRMDVSYNQQYLITIVLTGKQAINAGGRAFKKMKPRIIPEYKGCPPTAEYGFAAQSVEEFCEKLGITALSAAS